VSKTPEQVGPYRIVSQIGRGGMAVVYLAKQPVLARSVALKELAPFLAGDPALAQRFIREARVAGSLNHPNVVTVFDFLEQDGVPYIAMEYLERGSLRPFVGRMSLAQVAGVLEGLLAALSHAEAMKIVHRDVKPENLLVTVDGGIKIADFGIAKALQQVATEEMLTPAGATVGTPAYMAPEQAMAQEIGPWTDLYQTGVVAYELLAGQVPFQSEGAPLAVLMQHISDPVPPLPAGTNPELEAWVMRMLAKDSADRPRNARTAWNALEEIVLGVEGPLWRRDARLGEHEPTVEHPPPLTPARFSSWQDYVPAPTPRPAATPPPQAPPAPAASRPGHVDPVPAPREAEAAPEPVTGFFDDPPTSAGAPPAVTPPPLDPGPTVAPRSRPAAPDRPPRRAGVLGLGALGLVAAAIVVLLVVRGGGDDGGDPTPAPTASATATTTAAAPPAGPFAVGKTPDGIAIGAGAVWVVGSGDGTLTRIDPTSGETTSVDVGKNPDSVVLAFDSVWVSVTGANQVVRLSATDRPQVQKTFDVGSKPEGLAVSPQAIWVANSGDGTLSQIVEATGDVRSVKDVGGTPVDVAVGAGAVWVADASGSSVARVDGGRRRLVATVRGIGPNPRAVTIVGRDVWVATADDGRVWRVDSDTNETTGSVRVGGQPRDIATDGEDLFVTDREADHVFAIDPQELRITNRETVEDGPLSVAVDANDLWVTRIDADQVTRIAKR
jgi:hypothetical protein